MAEPAKPTYLVDADSDPVIVRIEGRASFQNSASLNDFFAAMIAGGKTRFVIDFENCSSMDSTFLGVLAGAALDLLKLQPAGTLVLARVGPRNLELIRNLGLEHILHIDTGGELPAASAPSQALPGAAKLDEVENARMVLAAHENLVAADEGNRAKFQDVLAFLKDRINQG
ncbi:MAG: STAS domain-containing protein [Verrucomicrobiota bacterium]